MAARVCPPGRAVPAIQPQQSNWRSTAREIVLYLVFGGLAAIANLAVGWLIYGARIAPGVPYWSATGAAATVGLLTNFGLNYWFNLKFYERSPLQQFGTFLCVSGFGVVLTAALSTFIRAIIHQISGPEIRFGHSVIHAEFAAHFIAVGLTLFYSYPAHKTISFNIGLCARFRQLRALTGVR